MSKDFIVSQYEECGRAASLYDNAIWQLPSTAFLISGVLISLAYGYVRIPYIRGIIMGIGAVWTFILFVVMNKHMFFAFKQKEKMIYIEAKEFKVPSLQRFGQPPRKLVEALHDFDYAFKGWETPKGLAKISGHTMLRLGMIILFVMLFALSVVNFIFSPVIN